MARFALGPPQLSRRGSRRAVQTDPGAWAGEGLRSVPASLEIDLRIDAIFSFDFVCWIWCIYIYYFFFFPPNPCVKSVSWHTGAASTETEKRQGQGSAWSGDLQSAVCIFHLQYLVHSDRAPTPRGDIPLSHFSEWRKCLKNKNNLYCLFPYLPTLPTPTS